MTAHLPYSLLVLIDATAFISKAKAIESLLQDPAARLGAVRAGWEVVRGILGRPEREMMTKK